MLPFSEASERNKDPILTSARCLRRLHARTGSRQRHGTTCGALRARDAADRLAAERDGRSNAGPAQAHLRGRTEEPARAGLPRRDGSAMGCAQGGRRVHGEHAAHHALAAGRGVLREPAGGDEAGDGARGLRAVPLRRRVHVAEQPGIRRYARRPRPGQRHSRLRGGEYARSACGPALRPDHRMPANNQTLVWKSAPAG